MASNNSSYNEIFVAYQDYCDRNSLTVEKPTEEHSTMIHGVMYLRETPVSYVARYDTRRQKFLA
ncbi:hypothetical protein [Leptothoe sp. PORK10 BA2]|uniref:hypothetical protein n=1 Tax=Leptothoe sp. PORK10 BA2 TaxID=3110254 RepID=UPI002B203DD4|nr:hypothetical protein [Leptothoe sp. PORK10 BA2]MEA5462267.1 hypothetical protein [Leptothoe sp. PORK10 BA2]